MKKLLLLFAVLLSTVSGWADVTDLPEITTDLNNPIYYTIYNTRSQQPGGPMYWAGDDVGMKDGGATLPIADKYKFYFTGSHDALYVHNAATTKKLASVGAGSSAKGSWTDEGTVWAVGVSPRGGGLAFGPKGGLNGNSCWNECNYTTGAGYPDFTTWSANDDGSVFVCEKIKDIVIPEVGKYYTIECPLFEQQQGEKKALYVDGTSLKWGSIDFTNKNYYWELVDNGGSYILRNIGTGTYLNESGAMSETYSNITIKVLAYYGLKQYNIVAGTYVLHAGGHASGNGNSGSIVNHSAGSNSASAWSFVERTNPDDATEIDVVYSFKYNGVEKRNQTTRTLLGVEYPGFTVDFPDFIVKPSKPEGQISSEGVVNGQIEKEFVLTDNLPFKASDPEENIENWYWYFMTLHATDPDYLNYVSDDAVLVSDMKTIDTSLGNATEAYEWAFVGNPFDGFSIINHAAGKDKALNAIEAGGAVGTATDNVFQITSSPHGTNGFYMQCKTGTYTNRFNRQGGLVVYWSGADAGSTFMVKDAVDISELNFELNDNAGNTFSGTYQGYQLVTEPTLTGAYDHRFSNKSFNESMFRATVSFPFPVSSKTGETADVSVLISGWKGTKAETYFKYYVDGSNVKVTSVSPTGENARNFEWSIYPYLDGSDFRFTIKNLGTGKYIQTTAEAEATEEGTVTVGDEATANYFNWEADNRFKIVGKNLRLSVTLPDTEDQHLGVDEGHNGCNTFITNTINYVNNWKTQNIAVLGYVGAYPAILQVGINAVENYSNMATFKSGHAEDIISLEEGQYYHIKCVAPKKGNSGDVTYNTLTFNGSSNLVTAQYDIKNVNQVFKFEKVSENEDKYYLLSPNAGKYLNKINQGNYRGSVVQKSEACKVELLQYADVFAQYRLHNSESNSAAHCLFAENHPTEAVPYGVSGWELGANSASAWYLIPATDTEIDVAISEAGAATFYTSVPVTIPVGVTAEYVKANGNEGSDGFLNYTLLKNTIPANSAVVLIGSPETYTFNVTSDPSETITDNLLFGYSADTSVEGTDHVNPADPSTAGYHIYALADIDEVVAFYPFAKTTYKAGKAYLDVSSILSSGLQVRSFNIFDNDNETAIKEVQSLENENVEIYDLSGRRLDKPAKGVNVIGGKLVVK